MSALTSCHGPDSWKIAGSTEARPRHKNTIRISRPGDPREHTIQIIHQYHSDRERRRPPRPPSPAARVHSFSIGGTDGPCSLALPLATPRSLFPRRTPRNYAARNHALSCPSLTMMRLRLASGRCRIFSLSDGNFRVASTWRRTKGNRRRGLPTFMYDFSMPRAASAAKAKLIPIISSP